MPQVYGPSHGGKLTAQPDVSFSWLAVTPFAARPWCRWAAGHQQVGRPRRQRGGVGTEVGHAPYAIATCKVKHRRFGIDPTEVVACEQAAAKGERAPVEIERGVWISLLNANRVSTEPVRLEQCAACAPNPYDGPSGLQGTGTRHPSRPFSLVEGLAIGAPRASGGRSATSGRPSSSP
jgi:hypothetical protein